MNDYICCLRKTLTILLNSLRLTFQELRVNKLRTFLSLIGISFGIFCIIGVLATVKSLELNIQNQLKSLGTNTIYIDKWNYAGGPDYPWWKYEKRPEPKYQEVGFLKERSLLASHIAFETNSQMNISYEDVALEGVNVTGFTAERIEINPLKIEYGRFISQSEFSYGSPVGIIGYTNAENLFGDASRAIGKTVKVKTKQVTIIGVIKKSGLSMIGDNPDMGFYVPYRFLRQIVDDDNASPKIIVKAKENVTSAALFDELTGIMRSIRKLSPTEEENFTLNQISALSDQVTSVFASISLGGWAIGILSLVVGAFGISNIMFVTVKERTPIIGLKKAIGAKKRSILSEFLLEAAIICILGGLMGLVLVFLLTLLLSNLMQFPVYISGGILSLAISICIIVGIVSGFIPAYSASRLDPVVAIRSK